MQDDRSDDVMNRLANGSLPLTKLSDGTAILLDLSGKQVLSLNESAACIVEAIIRGERSTESLAEEVVSSFDVSIDAARSDVEGLLATLHGLMNG